MNNYEGKYGTQENDDKDVLANLFLDSVTPDLADTDEALREMAELEEKTEREERQRKVVEDRLSLVLGLILIMALLSAIADGKAKPIKEA